MSFTNANVLILLNAAQERISGRILTETSGGNWKWGDPAFSALPTYTQNLTAGTAFYQIDALTDPLVILGVEVANNSGDFQILKPITLDEIHSFGIAQSEFNETNGLPQYYEKREHGVVLYPAPAAANVTLTGGLRIFFLRGMSDLTDATATTDISLPVPWHDFLAYDVSLVFGIAKGLENINQIRVERDKREKELMRFIGLRNQDDRPVMTMAPAPSVSNNQGII